MEFINVGLYELGEQQKRTSCHTGGAPSNPGHVNNASSRSHSGTSLRKNDASDLARKLHEKIVVSNFGAREHNLNGQKKDARK